jgi:hypothetical protein
MVLSLIAGWVTGAFHSPRLFPGVGIIAISLGGLSRSVYGGRPSMRRGNAAVTVPD